MQTTFPSCLSCREPGEQQANEHAQCKRAPDATPQNRAIRGAAQRRGRRCHGYRPAMMSLLQDEVLGPYSVAFGWGGSRCMSTYH